MQSSWRPSELAWCKRLTNSPARIGGGFVKRFGHASADGVAHTWNRDKVERLLDAPPVVFRHENGIGTFAGNFDGLVRLSGFIKELVKLGTSLSDGK